MTIYICSFTNIGDKPNTLCKYYQLAAFDSPASIDP